MLRYLLSIVVGFSALIGNASAIVYVSEFNYSLFSGTSVRGSITWEDVSGPSGIGADKRINAWEISAWSFQASPGGNTFSISSDTGAVRSDRGLDTDLNPLDPRNYQFVVAGPSGAPYVSVPWYSIGFHSRPGIYFSGLCVPGDPGSGECSVAFTGHIQESSACYVSPFDCGEAEFYSNLEVRGFANGLQSNQRTALLLALGTQAISPEPPQVFTLVSAVPEPAEYLLLSAGLLSAAGMAKARRRGKVVAARV